MFSSVARIMSNIIKVSTDEGEALRIAVASLRAGKVIAVPTDTLYGLATSAQDPSALRLLYEIKARDEHKAVAICLSSVSEIDMWADISHLPGPMLNSLLPGAVTIVVNRRKNLNADLNPGNPTIGVRVPDHDFITSVAKEFGQPIALSSANFSSESSSLSVCEFAPLWPELAAIFDGGTIAGSREGSTVIDLTVPNSFKILRQGSAYDTALSTLLKFNLRYQK